MTKYTKRNYEYKTKSRTNDFSKAVCFKNNKKPNRNTKLLKHKDYVYGNEVHVRREEVQNDQLHNGGRVLQKFITSELCQNGDKNGLEYKEAHQVVPVSGSKGLNSISNSTRCKTKLLECELCTDSFSSKKSLEHHKKKTHMNEISKPSKQKNKREQSEKQVVEYSREEHGSGDDALNNIEVQTTERVIQMDVQANKILSNGQEIEVVRSSSRIGTKIVKRRVSRKRSNKEESDQTLLDSGVLEEHDFSNFYKSTITHDTRLEQCINKTEETNGIHAVQKRMVTRSVTGRRTLDKSLKDATFNGSVSVVSEEEATKVNSSGDEILNNSKGSISKFTLEDSNNKEELNEIRHESIIRHNLQMVTRFHKKPNHTLSCNLCSGTFFSDKTSTEDNNGDHLVLNRLTRQRKSSKRNSFKLQRNENVAETTSQTNLSMLIDSKLRSDYNASQQFEHENEYEINKSIAIGKSTKAICGNTEKEIMVSECHIPVNKKEQQKTCNVTERRYSGKARRSGASRNSRVRTIQAKNSNEKNRNLVKPVNFIPNKELVIPLIKVENLPLSQLSVLVKSSDSVGNRAKDQQQQVYHASNIVEVQCSVRKQYKNTEIKTNSVIQTCKSQEKSSNSYLGQEVSAQVKTIDLVSIHQYNKEKLERRIEEKSSQINEKDCEVPLNNGMETVEPLKKNVSELQASQLENTMNFFLRHKEENTINKRVNVKSKLHSRLKLREHEIRRGAAVCSKCKQVFNLLLQFSDKVNFVKDERLRIECTLCGLQIYSLSHFQRHIMDIHLPCESVSGIREKQFEVDILHFNEQMNLNNSSKDRKKIIFECWCCLKTYYRKKNFQNHIEKVHHSFHYSKDNVKKCEEKEVARTPELYKKFDVTNNTTDTFNQSEKNMIQTSDLIDEYYFNNKKINLKNSVCYTNSNEVKRSSVTHITQEISKSKTSIKDLNNEHSDLSKISNISLTSESQIIDFSNVKNNRKRKNGSFLYVCDACPKTYKRKHSLLLHMSTHTTGSNIDVNKEQEISKENRIIKFESNAFVSNEHVENIQNHSSNCKDNNLLDSAVGKKYLEEAKCNISTSKENSSKEISNDRNENIKHLTERENIALGTDNAFDCDYLLHINLTQKSKKGIKRQKSIKFNINITKKCKTNDTEQKTATNQIVNKFPLNYTNTNCILKTSKKEIRCSMCDKRFNSQRVLKEHMFFLHDSIFEATELSNLFTPYFDDLFHLESISTQSIDKFKREYNILSRIKMPGMLIERDKIHEKAISKVVSKNSATERNRKWRCNDCKENFALIRNYLRHKYYYHNDESVVHVCGNCNKVLTSVAMVNIHICTNVNSWNCKRCNSTFTNGISLTQHNVNHHFETAGPHVCDLCKLNFLTMYMLQRHKFTHTAIDNNSNATDSVDLSIKDNLPHSLKSSETEHPRTETEPVNDKDMTCINKNAKDLNETSGAVKVPSETNTISNVISLPCDEDELFKCKLCNIICFTKIQMKVHFEKWHNIKVEMCQLCNDLYILDELTKHLISRHIILDDSDLKENNINGRTCDRMKDLQKDIVRILGLKRLLSLYEYQRFDNVPKNKCFNCVTCVKEFSDVQSYKIHYLKYHDAICLLCNIKFKHSYHAFVHKIKIHTSVDVYLWLIQKIIAAILQFHKHGSTMEDIILQYSNRKSCDEEKRFTNAKEHNSTEGFETKFPEYFWLKNYYQFEKLRDSNTELLYAVEKFKSSAELSENVNTSIIIIDHSNYKHSSVLNNCELGPQNINKVLS